MGIALCSLEVTSGAEEVIGLGNEDLISLTSSLKVDWNDWN